MLYLGSDHAGFGLKEKLKESLAKQKIKFVDLGPANLVKTDDYPPVALAVGQAVVKNKLNRGILICGSGLGMAVAANKIKGVRATPIYDQYTAKNSRLDDDANIATLRARNFSDRQAIQLALLWLKTKFSNQARHARRIKQILAAEK